jgi:hypothetical protein
MAVEREDLEILLMTTCCRGHRSPPEKRVLILIPLLAMSAVPPLLDGRFDHGT